MNLDFIINYNMYVFKIIYLCVRAWLPVNVLGEEARGGENSCLMDTNFSLKSEAGRVTIKNQGHSGHQRVVKS